ncbi:MAG TPA: PRC-barrel domain-containing protein [Thermoanaerobaculia bacterium]|jgi:sporulation protein YlmC with PRC-barrel domain|nr:PRC-barrel domain-containing protein [Thermoanaerobaculia bacterium]
MSTSKNEVKLELLLGTSVVDSNGEHVGHIEEVLADRDGDELLVTHYLVGRYGLFERFSIHHIGLGVLRYLGSRAQSEHPHRIPWHKMDLSDPEHPRLTCSIDELKNRDGN